MTNDASAMQTVVDWGLGVITGLLGILGGVYKGKIDETAKELGDLKGEAVTREELNRHLDAIAKSRQQMHIENTRKLERIDDSLQRVYDKIDAIPFRSQHSRTRANDPPLRGTDRSKPAAAALLEHHGVHRRPGSPCHRTACNSSPWNSPGSRTPPIRAAIRMSPVCRRASTISPSTTRSSTRRASLSSIRRSA